MKKIILLAGPTASGKSALALDWADQYDGEIVNSDSMQIYAELHDITARPSREEVTRCPHHLYGVLRSDDPCSAERWRAMAYGVIEDIWVRGKTPIVVGGTGLYFKSLTVGLSEVPEIDPAIRREIRETVTSETVSEAYLRLKELDPEMASKLAPGDCQRIARALEVVLSTGKSLAYWQTIPPTGGLNERDDLEILRRVTVMDRARLYARCDRRFRQMIEQGKAIQEVRHLLELKYVPSLPVMKSLGVPQIIRYLRDEISLEEAISLSQTVTRQFAKRQMTWFRNQCGDWNPIDL